MTYPLLLPVGFVMSALLMTGCVSQKEYDALLSSKARTDRENIRLAQVEKDCEETLRQLNQTLSSLTNTEGVLQDYKDSFARMTTSRDSLKKEYDALDTDFAAYMESAENREAYLTRNLDLKQTELNDKERIVRGLEAAIYANPDELRRKEQRTRTMDAIVVRFQERLDSLRLLSERAFINVNPEYVSVQELTGHVRVSVANSILFSPGSATLTIAGSDAIANLASALLNGPNCSVVVKGDPNDTPLAGFSGNLLIEQELSILNSMMEEGYVANMLITSDQQSQEFISTIGNESVDLIATTIILIPSSTDLVSILSSD